MPNFTATVVQADFWESRDNHGARGCGLTFERAAALAERMMAGGAWNAV